MSIGTLLLMSSRFAGFLWFPELGHRKSFRGISIKQSSLEDCFVKMYRFVLDPSITRPYTPPAPQGVDATGFFDNSQLAAGN